MHSFGKDLSLEDISLVNGCRRSLGESVDVIILGNTKLNSFAFTIAEPIISILSAI